MLISNQVKRTTMMMMMRLQRVRVVKTLALVMKAKLNQVSTRSENTTEP